MDPEEVSGFVIEVYEVRLQASAEPASLESWINSLANLTYVGSLFTLGVVDHCLLAPVHPPAQCCSVGCRRRSR